MRMLACIVGLLGFTEVACAAAPLSGDDLALCQAGRPVLLMTAPECREYVSQVRRLARQGDTTSLLALRVRHENLLDERLRACDCAARPEASEATQVAAVDC